MRIRILGCGWYGSHVACELLAAGYDVEVHEIADKAFAGASGNNPARLHMGAHYCRSRETRASCQENYVRFMARYGFLTRCIPLNIYAVAKEESLVDFGNYVASLRNEIEFITVHEPAEFGLVNVEGAIMTAERVTLPNAARTYFTNLLGERLKLNKPADDAEASDFDLTVDCTFCAIDERGVDRYEACVTFLFEGPDGQSITIMDGPFPSIYAHETPGVSSLTSARFTPIARCRTMADAKRALREFGLEGIRDSQKGMADSMAHYYPEFVNRYRPLGQMLAIRAMPASAADSRIINVQRDGDVIRLRPAKIDTIFTAAEIILKEIGA